jgi:hypothetical protein
MSSKSIPGVVEVGEKFFGLDKSKFNLHLEDGRYFLNASEEEYDVVILDAFLGDSSPSHLMSRECFESMSQRMKTMPSWLSMHSVTLLRVKIFSWHRWTKPCDRFLNPSAFMMARAGTSSLLHPKRKAWNPIAPWT